MAGCICVSHEQRSNVSNSKLPDGRPSQRPGPFLWSLRHLRQLASEPDALSRVRPGLGPCLRLQVARSRWVPGRRRPSQRSGPFLWSLAPEAACQCARPGPQYLWSLSPESVRASEPSLKCLAAESARPSLSFRRRIGSGHCLESLKSESAWALSHCNSHSASGTSHRESRSPP